MRPNKFLRFAGAGLQIGITIWLGNQLGQWFSLKYNIPSLEELFTFIAIITAMYAVIKQVIKLSE